MLIVQATIPRNSGEGMSFSKEVGTDSPVLDASTTEAFVSRSYFRSAIGENRGSLVGDPVAMPHTLGGAINKGYESTDPDIKHGYTDNAYRKLDRVGMNELGQECHMVLPEPSSKQASTAPAIHEQNRATTLATPTTAERTRLDWTI